MLNIHRQSSPVLPVGSKVHACLTHCIHPEMMPCHTDVALVCSWACERSAATAMFSRWRARKTSKMQHFWLIRILPHTLWKRVHCHSAPLYGSEVRLLSVHVVARWTSELSSGLLKALLSESLPYPQLKFFLILSEDYEDLQLPVYAPVLSFRLERVFFRCFSLVFFLQINAGGR